MMAYLDAAPQRLAPRRFLQRRFPLKMLSDVLDEDTGKLMEYRKIMKKPNYRHLYRKSYTKEIGRLKQGMPGLVECTEKMFFIDKQDILVYSWKGVTYGIVVVDYHSDKNEPHCTRLTMGGDRANYPGDCGTPTVILNTVKLLLNSIVLTIDAHFMTINIKDF